MTIKAKALKVLLIGSGGRECALAWKLRQSKGLKELYCAPGNAGIAAYAELVDIAATDIAALVQFAVEQEIDYVVVAPDDPLALGLVDALAAKGIPAFGPTAAAAKIEASKAFAKDLMKKHQIPTAAYEVFSDYAAAAAYIKNCPLPVVIKADGLALGKGVVIAETRATAEQFVKEIMLEQKFGQAGHKLVIEEFLEGPELTVLAFTDGNCIKAMPSSRDHKRALDHDQGLNTGGMGAVSPGADLDATTWDTLHQTIFQPTIAALNDLGTPFKGAIYFGLMLTKSGPKVIEYNARFGDPECQTVLPLLETDLLEIMLATTAGTLEDLEISWSKKAACCVVLASGGYPEAYAKGYPISGLTAVKDALIFQAGTTMQNQQLVTNGGRVLAVVALDSDLDTAISKAYQEIAKIEFKDKHLRRDIGKTLK